MKLSNFKTDQSAEVNGVWTLIAKGDPAKSEPDFRIKIARIGNTEHERRQREATKGRQAVLRITGELSADETNVLAKDMVADCILLDWEGLADDDGSMIPYSKEKARQLFDSHPDFYKIVVTEANNVAHFRPKP